MALGRVYCKVYIRMPWVGKGRLKVMYFAQQFVKAATDFAAKPMHVSCFRCGIQEKLAGLDAPAQIVKVCSALTLRLFSQRACPLDMKQIEVIVSRDCSTGLAVWWSQSKKFCPLTTAPIQNIPQSCLIYLGDSVKLLECSELGIVLLH